MQTLSNILNMPIKITNCAQAPALGAAMYAATAAGVYGSVSEAIDAMGNGFEASYHPEPKMTSYYREKYNSYIQLGQFIENQFSK